MVQFVRPNVYQFFLATNPSPGLPETERYCGSYLTLPWCLTDTAEVIKTLYMCQMIVLKKSNTYPNVTLACEDREIGKGAHKVILTSGYWEVEQI